MEAIKSINPQVKEPSMKNRLSYYAYLRQCKKIKSQLNRLEKEYSNLVVKKA